MSYRRNINRHDESMVRESQTRDESVFVVAFHFVRIVRVQVLPNDFQFKVDRMIGTSRSRRYLTYTLLSLAWLGLAYLGSDLIADRPLWVALLITPLISAPLLLAGLYAATVRRIRRTALFSSSGLLRRLATGRVLVTIFWLLWSITSAFLLLLYLRTANTADWLLLLAAIPLFALLALGSLRMATRELKPYIALHASLAGSRWLFAVAMALLQLALATGTTAIQPIGLAEAIATASSATPIATSDSVLIRETVSAVDWYRGVKTYSLGHLRDLNNLGYLALVFSGSLALFFNIALALSAFAISPAEYRRLVTPVIDTDEAAPVSGRAVASAVAVTTFVTLFVYLPLAAYLELWLSANPAVVEDLHEAQARAVRRVEQIENSYYQSGTIDQIEQLRASTLAQMEPGVAAIIRDSDRGYQLMAENVDGYLDWYYSLPAEYGRILALLSGNIEEVLAQQLQEYLTRGNAFGALEASIGEAMALQEQLQLTYDDSLKTILANNERPFQDDEELQVTKRMSLNAVMAAPSHASLTSLEGRLLASGAAGAAITGLVATKITAKIIGKGTIKLGAKALTKVAASKASGALGGGAAGAAAGAAIGSVVPGIGTVIGGTIGGIVGGIVVGVSVEALLLVLEEALSREDFKRELMQSIEESRREFNDRISAAAIAAAQENTHDQGFPDNIKDTQHTP